MDTHEFDQALIGAVFEQAGLVGWRSASMVDAARDAGLDLGRVRGRFPGKAAVLLRFGVIADQAILASAPSMGTPREKVFDLVMARFDQLQQHRQGVLALIEALRTDPATTLMLYGATVRSMRWLLDVAGVPTQGPVGALRVQGMGILWAYALRAWEKDDGADLPATMAAVDRGLDRAMQAEGIVPGARMDDAGVAEMTPEQMADDPAPMPVAVPVPGPAILPGEDVAGSKDGPAVI